jgi:hypothetical protein
MSLQGVHIFREYIKCRDCTAALVFHTMVICRIVWKVQVSSTRFCCTFGRDKLSQVVSSVNKRTYAGSICTPGIIQILSRNEKTYTKMCMEFVGVTVLQVCSESWITYGYYYKVHLHTRFLVFRTPFEEEI